MKFQVGSGIGRAGGGGSGEHQWAWVLDGFNLVGDKREALGFRGCVHERTGNGATGGTLPPSPAAGDDPMGDGDHRFDR